MMKSQKVIVGVGLAISVVLLAGIVFQIRTAQQERLADNTSTEINIDIDKENEEDKEIKQSNLSDNITKEKESLKTLEQPSNLEKEKQPSESNTNIVPKNKITTSKTRSTSNATSGSQAATDENGVPQGMKTKTIEPKPTEPPITSQATDTNVTTTPKQNTTSNTDNTEEVTNNKNIEASKETTTPSVKQEPTTPTQEKPEIIKGGTGSDGILRDLNGNPVPWGQGETTPHIIDSKDLGRPGEPGMGEGDKF